MSSYETYAESHNTLNAGNDPRIGILPFPDSLNKGEGGARGDLNSSRGTITELNVVAGEHSDNLGNPNILLNNLKANNIDRII